MCHFFSFLSDAKGNYYYADWELRKKILSGEVKVASNMGPDSHSWLAKHFLANGKEDKLNKYEYNPLTKVFTVDQINTEDDRVSAEKWCWEVDWKRIVKPLNLKEIENPLLGAVKKLSNQDKKLLKQWASVRNSVWNSVSDSVGNSVGASVWNSVRDSVRNSVWNSVGDSVWNSVGASVWNSVSDSVWNSVRDSVWNSVWAYHGSFYDIEYKIDITPSNKLWERGFIASFDGTTWRLHSGKNAEIVWEWKP